MIRRYEKNALHNLLDTNSEKIEWEWQQPKQSNFYDFYFVCFIFVYSIRIHFINKITNIRNSIPRRMSTSKIILLREPNFFNFQIEGLIRFPYY